MSEMFKEGTKTPLGKLRTNSGTLALTDGIHASSLQGFQGIPVVCLDIEREDIDIPIYGLIADGKRYILLAVDEASPVPSPGQLVEIDANETIETEDEEEDSNEDGA